MKTEELTFILNLLANNTNEIELYRTRLEEFCDKDKDFKRRINNVLELLKIGE